MPPQYIVQRCKKYNLELYGPRHAADSNRTLCGYDYTDGKWFVTHNNGEMHLVTCKRCLKSLSVMNDVRTLLTALSKAEEGR